MIITDSQIHLWPPNTLERPWAQGAQPDLPSPMTAETYLPMMRAAGVDRAIIAPPGVCGFDSSYALECARRHPDRLAVTSRWNFFEDPKAERLETWLAQPGMIGVRAALLPGKLGELRDLDLLKRFWSAAEEHAVPLMLFAPGTLPEIENAARAHPQLKLTVDHMNLVGSTPDTIPGLVSDLARLARFPNVAVKLGALPLRSSETYPFTDLHPHLREVYYAFGAERLMWASDLTTSLKAQKADYAENLGLIREAYRDLGDNELEMILGGTASALFNWPIAAK